MNIKELNKKLQQFFEKNLIQKQYLSETANLKQTDTGLPMIVWIDTPLDRKMKHNLPRLKFQADTSTKNTKNLCSMSIEDNPKILDGNTRKLKEWQINQLKQWIILNKKDLLKVWNDELSQIEFGKNNKKLGD